jgi:hypothetical protein
MARCITHQIADGECPTCGLVGHDVGRDDEGECYEALSRETFIDREADLAERSANPNLYEANDPEDVPF